MGRRAVLFDLDGTLVDLRRLHWQALNLALAEVGWPAITIEQNTTTYNGLPTRTKLELLGVPDWLRDSVNASKQEHTMLMLSTGCRRDERLLDELEKIGKEAFIGVVSNALNDTCVAVFMRTGIGRHVKMLIAGPHERPKPDPGPFLKALSAAHLDPKDTIAVEDNHYGIEAAENAGLRCLRVAGPSDVTYEFVMSGFS